MAARASSPTSLLWAHQLKQEHGYLLKRMQDLEANSDRQAKRFKIAEMADKSGSNADVAALAKQIKALEEGGVSDRFSKLEGEMKHKTEELEAGSEAITLQIAAMQKDTEALDDEKRKAFTKEKALLKRIGELETGLKTYEQSMMRLRRLVDETRLEQIKGQLEGLSKEVVREGSQMKMLTESVNVLETANEELQKSNQHLAAELEKLAARPALALDAPHAEIDAEEQDMSSITDVAPQRSKKKNKKHKWSGGGADRDIIMTGAQMLGDSVITAPSTRQQDAQEPKDLEDQAAMPKKPRLPPKPKQKYKPVPPHFGPATPSNQSSLNKSHKWSGGGADRDIIRSGRGWVEVAASSGAEENPMGATQRLPLPPKKRMATPRWTVEEAMTQGRAMRRGKQAQDAVKEDDVEQTQRRVVTKASTKSKKPAGKPATESMGQRKRRPGQNLVASSLVIASPPRLQAAPARRRRIVQDD